MKAEQSGKGAGQGDARQAAGGLGSGVRFFWARLIV